MIRVPFAAAAATLLLCPPVLAGQERADTAALPEIVVTATRYPASADSVAATVTVIRGEDLRTRGVRFVADALREIPGAQVVQNGPYGSATSLFVRGGESDYVKVLVDGVPVNQPGGAFDLGSLTTDNVERIEVLRGPGSVLYGSDAISGVVQIITRQGEGRAAATATAEGGSFGSARVEGSALGGGPWGGWSASLSRLTSDGTYAFNNDYRNTSASARVGVAPDDRSRVGVSGRWYDAVYHFPTDFIGTPVDHNQHTTDRTLALAVDGARRLSAAVEAQLLLGRSDMTATFVNLPDPPPGPPDASSSRVAVDRTSAEGRLQLRLPAGIRGVAGSAFEREHQNDGTADRDRDNWGFYAQATATPLDRLQLTAGGRLDQNQRFGDFWTYRASALAFVASHTRVRASVGTGFKEPSFFENFDSPFSVGNPDLRPERTFGVEGGVDRDLLGDRLGVSVTLFAQRFRDLVQYTFLTAAPTDPNYFNVAAANASGVEATVRVRPRGPVQGSVSYTHLATRVTDAGFDSGDAATFLQGDRLLRRPDDAVTLRADAALADRLRLGATLLWVGSRDDIRFALFPEPERHGHRAAGAARQAGAGCHGAGGEPAGRGLRAGGRLSGARPGDLRGRFDDAAVGAHSAASAAWTRHPSTKSCCSWARRSSPGRSSSCSSGCRGSTARSERQSLSLP
jgi:vitamin B12 transporter